MPPGKIPALCGSQTSVQPYGTALCVTLLSVQVLKLIRCWGLIDQVDVNVASSEQVVATFSHRVFEEFAWLVCL
jgi:hypothetical protein